ncbi:MAG: cupin domain-containing protein [Gemmatimonadetes bacterium]|nr:cupin domain-containing protein [Gemmatimonadota bacterium]
MGFGGGNAPGAGGGSHRGHGRHVKVPYRVEKPWGYELIWALTDRYVGKILHIEPGQVLSLQYHNRKDETIHVLAGEIIFRVKEGDALAERRMRAGESYHIAPLTVHQFEAVTAADLLEASTPEIDDVVRLQDRYGRA